MKNKGLYSMRVFLFWLPLIESLFLVLLIYYQDIPYMEFVPKSMGGFLYLVPFVFVGTLMVGFIVYILKYFPNYWISPYPYITILVIIYKALL